MQNPNDRPPTTINLSTSEYITSRADQRITVLCGTNNCGKSFLLRTLSKDIGADSYYLACQRFYNFNILNSRGRSAQELLEQFQSFVNQFNSSTNYDNNHVNMENSLTALNAPQTDQLLEICTDLIGDEFALLPTIDNSYFSQHYVSVNGYNMSYSSSGSRLLMTILAVLLNPDYHVVLIDEPELGLSPSLQTKLAEFMYDPTMRVKYFPHLEHIYVATHSHIFLDRDKLDNNFVVQKQGQEISIEQVKTFNELHNLQFNLLGNSLETLFLPSLIVILEGKTDSQFIKRVLDIKFPASRITYIVANGDGAIKERVHSLNEFLGDITKSPYRDRIIIVTDSSHSPTLKSDLTKMGVHPENIIEWEGNGIEFYYPEGTMVSIFNCSYLCHTVL